MMIPDRIVVTPASRPRRAALGDQMARRTPGRIQPPGCPVRSVATATGFTQMLRASSSRAAGCCIQGTSADTLIVRRQRDDVREPLSAMPNATGHHTGSPILQADQRYWAADHAQPWRKARRQLARNRPGQGQAGHRNGTGRWVGRQRPPRRASAHYSPVRARACATACSVA